jgi:hypothetical protein
MAENQKKRRLFYPEQGPSPQIYVPFSISLLQLQIYDYSVKIIRFAATFYTYLGEKQIMLTKC